MAKLTSEFSGKKGAPQPPLVAPPVEVPVNSRSSAATLVCAAGRDPTTVTFEKEVVRFFVDAADMLGVPKSIAAIYGICFASAAPLSFVDINERLAISIGSVSQGVRVLHEVGALKKVGSHDRRDYYTPDIELRKLAAHFIEERLEKQLTAGKTRLLAMQAAVPCKNDGSAKKLSERIAALQAWYNQGRALVPLIKTFLKLT